MTLLVITKHIIMKVLGTFYLNYESRIKWTGFRHSTCHGLTFCIISLPHLLKEIMYFSFRLPVDSQFVQNIQCPSRHGPDFHRPQSQIRGLGVPATNGRVYKLAFHTPSLHTFFQRLSISCNIYKCHYKDMAD